MSSFQTKTLVLRAITLLLAGGCASRDLRAASQPGPLYRGLFVGAHTDMNLIDIQKSIEEISSLGGNTIAIKVAEFQDDFRADVIAPEPEITLPLQTLRGAIRTIKKHNMAAVLLPILLLRRTETRREWRGMIAPSNTPRWFQSYRQMILKYARLAHEERADILSIGSELSSMEQFSLDWSRIIREVRQEFPGRILYAFNWDHLSDCKKWTGLDYLGVSSYFELTRFGEAPDPSRLRARWEPIRNKIHAWRKRCDLPVFFAETGFPSRENGLFDPWDHLKSALASDETQRLGYDSFLAMWGSDPNVSGVVFYEWHGQGGRTDSGYTPRGKSAETLLRNWFSKY